MYNASQARPQQPVPGSNLSMQTHHLFNVLPFVNVSEELFKVEYCVYNQTNSVEWQILAVLNVIIVFRTNKAEGVTNVSCCSNLSAAHRRNTMHSVAVLIIYFTFLFKVTAILVFQAKVYLTYFLMHTFSFGLVGDWQMYWSPEMLCDGDVAYFYLLPVFNPT